MNSFFTDNFNISKIIVCVYVNHGTGQTVHKNRPGHGLVIQLGGAKRYVFNDGTEMTVRDGDVFYLPRFSSYQVIEIERGDCIAVNFELADKDITYPHFMIKSPVKSGYEADFSDLLACWNGKRPGHLNECCRLLYSIICRIQRDAMRNYVPSETRKMADGAIDYIRKNIGSCELTVSELAANAGVSAEYFRKIFGKVYGISPRKYIITERIKLAKELILSEEFSVGQVSDMCGFESVSYFSREFKKYTGSAPTQFRKGL